MKYESLQEYFDKTGTTERQLARLLDISQQHVYNLRVKKRTPSLGLAIALRDLTGVPIESFLS